MAKFTKGKAETADEAAAVKVTAPVGERGMVVVKLAVPPWQEPAISIFRDELQNWLNKVHCGELKPGDQLVLVVP